jgi:hypothetical protein
MRQHTNPKRCNCLKNVSSFTVACTLLLGYQLDVSQFFANVLFLKLFHFKNGSSIVVSFSSVDILPTFGGRTRSYRDMYSLLLKPEDMVISTNFHISVKPVNTKGGSINVLLTCCFTGLESAV